MPGGWTISAAGRVYGPFSPERMRAFAAEGRLAANSLVAPEGTAEWREASTDPEFADLFDVQRKERVSPAQQAVPAGERTPSLTPAKAETRDGQRAQFAVLVDLKSHGSNNLENAIASFGPYYQLLPNIWIVSTEQSVTAVRNRLIQELGKSDSLFVIDASRGASWFNFGPDADVCIRKVWQKAS